MRKWSKSSVPILGTILILLAVVFSGCTASEETSTVPTTTTQTTTASPMATTSTTVPTSSIPKTRIVKDKDGNEIEIPYNVERVAPQIGAMAHMTALMGCANRIVCAADTNLNATFRKIFPQYVQANPKGLSTSNVEDVIASKAQVLYGPITDAATIQKYNAAGIAVVPLNTFSTAEQMKDNIRKIAEILGGDAITKAEEFCKYYDEQIAWCKTKTGSLSKVKILSLSYTAGAYGTINSTDICSVYMDAAGGTNVAGEIKTVTGISTENVIQWNPDVIITMNSTSKKQILSETTLQSVAAVKNSKVYIIPWGAYLWSVRSAEGAMMPLWLAKTMHGDDLPDLDMKNIVKDYYSKFYSYNISDQEIVEILAGSQQ